MFTHRQDEILQFLKQHGYSRINEIAKAIYVSDATVRRELVKLKKLGLIERDHGGAMLLQSSDDTHIFIRKEHDPYDKMMTAEIAYRHLPDFATIFIDNSSTALALSKMIDFKHKTVVTNGLTLAAELAKQDDVTVIIPGGSISDNSNSVIGPMAARFISSLHFDVYLGSCAAISKEGTYESSDNQAIVKQLAFDHSDYRILIVDKNKFNRATTFRTFKLDQFDLICTNADDETIKALDAKNINIINKE